MRTYSFYYADSGLFSTRRYSGDGIIDATANAPTGTIPIEGSFDYRCHRLNLTTGEAVDYQPPRPSDDHEWDETAKRWKLKAYIAEKLDIIARAKTELKALDASEIRAISDLLVSPDDPEAKARFMEVRAKKAAERENLKHG